MSRALLILACSATKRADAGDLPALQRYDGPAFRVLRKALRERAGLSDVLTICILSAEYGLIGADTPIPDYDRRMTRARAWELYLSVQQALNDRRPLPARRFVSVSAVYGVALPPLVWAEYARGGQGQRLGQLRAWMWEIEL